MPEIKLIDIVKMLVESGHKIEYIKRNDGSIRITSIDGRRYTGSQGNAEARGMVGVSISSRRLKQLTRIGKAPRKRRKKPLSDKLQKQLRRTQRLWRKRKTKGEGTITTQNVRFVAENYGEEEAMRRLLEAERYSQGLAYTENVKALIKYINDTILPKASDRDAPYIVEAMTLIAQNISTFKEEWIMPVYNLFYDYNQKKLSINDVLEAITKLFD